MSKTTAQNHRIRQNRHRYRRPRWASAQLRDGRRLTRRRMTIHSIPMMNPGEVNFYPQVLPRRRHPDSWKENRALDCPSQKKENVATHLWGLWTVASWAEGHTSLVLNKLETQDSKSRIHILHYFSTIVYKWYVAVTCQPCAHKGDS